MAYYDLDWDIREVDILEVLSVSDMVSGFKTPAADAVKMMGGDDIAVFSPQLGLMAVTSQYDLEVGRPAQISSRSSRLSPMRNQQPRRPSSSSASVSPKAEPAWSSRDGTRSTCLI